MRPYWKCAFNGEFTVTYTKADLKKRHQMLVGSSILVAFSVQKVISIIIMEMEYVYSRCPGGRNVMNVKSLFHPDFALNVT